MAASSACHPADAVQHAQHAVCASGIHGSITKPDAGPSASDAQRRLSDDPSVTAHRVAILVRRGALPYRGVQRWGTRPARPSGQPQRGLGGCYPSPSSASPSSIVSNSYRVLPSARHSSQRPLPARHWSPCDSPMANVRQHQSLMRAVSQMMHHPAISPLQLPRSHSNANVEQICSLCRGNARCSPAQQMCAVRLVHSGLASVDVLSFIFTAG